MERIFQVCVVVDGRASDPGLLKELEEIDSGSIPHWHGLRPDIHPPGKSDADDKAAHGSRIQVLFNAEKRGVAESRADAVQFIQLLAEKHEITGLKSPQEDLILLLMKSGVQFSDLEWLSPVTGALIVPPPLLVSHENAALAAMKLANAVVFNTEGHGKTTSFDTTFKPIISDASAEEINRSDGTSYPTPAWNGAAIAMRLETYHNLPAQDTSLTEAWAANLELSLNLWLCADGMDTISDLAVITEAPMEQNPLSPELAARFSAAWMDDQTWNKFFHAYAKTYTKITHLEWETLMSKARGSEYFPIDLTERCRSFSWYAEQVNKDITEALALAEEEIKKEKEEEKMKEKQQKQQEQLQEMQKAMDEQQQRAIEKKKEEAAAAAAAAKDDAANANPQADAANNAKPEDNGIPGEPQAVAEQKAAEQQQAAGDENCQKPTVPLRANNLEIISKAKKVDITYKDVSGGHVEHPHMGAKDENGNFGYVHDETALRKNPPPSMNFTGAALEKACKKRDNNWRMLTEKVRVDMKAHEEAEKSGKKRDKIFCLVYTIEKGHPKIPAIRETWG